MWSSRAVDTSRRGKRISVFLVLVAATISLSGCSFLLESPNDTASEAFDGAQHMAARGTCLMARRFGSLALGLPPGSMTVASLDGVSLNNGNPNSNPDAWYSPWYDPADPPSTEAIFPSSGPARAPNPPYGYLIYSLDSTMTASSVGYYVGAQGQAPSNFGGSTYSDVYGCAILTLAYQTSMVTVTDETCPSWLLSTMPNELWGKVSLSGVSQKYLGTSQWQVTPFIGSDPKPYYLPEGVVPWPTTGCI